MEDKEREATAYHEAGHAVMALALGRPVASVSIVPDQQYLGLCAFGKAVFRPSEDWIEREALIALAGLAAEVPDKRRLRLGRGRQGPALRRGADPGDRRQRTPGACLLKRLLSKAEHLLSREENCASWRAWCASLSQRETISGRTARHLFEEGQRER